VAFFKIGDSQGDQGMHGNALLALGAIKRLLCMLSQAKSLNPITKILRFGSSGEAAMAESGGNNFTWVITRLG
jgi:hypothetical protein